MVQYFKHSPILLTFEHECANLLWEGQTYQLEELQGRRLERLLRAGRIIEETRLEDGDLIDFMLSECLVSLQKEPADSTFAVKDFRQLDNHQSWLWLRALCFGFVLVVGIVDFVVLPGSYRGFIAVQEENKWLGTILLLPMLLHEMVHYLTGRMFGLIGRPGVGLRGWLFLVATVTFPNLYKLPKHLRWVPILTPMTLDCVIFMLLLPFREIPMVAFFHFSYGAGIFWQFLVFLRTDIYLFVATMFNQPNLNQLVWRRNSGEPSSGNLLTAEKHAKLFYFGFFTFSLLIMVRFISLSL